MWNTSDGFNLCLEEKFSMLLPLWLRAFAVSTMTSKSAYLNHVYTWGKISGFVNVSGFINLGCLDSRRFTSIRVAFSPSPARRVKDLSSENTIFFYNPPVVNLQMTLLSSSKLPAEKGARAP